MTSPHTIPALREQAQRVRATAEKVLAKAAKDAKDLRDAADEIDADADERLSRQNDAAPLPPETPPCVNCQFPVVMTDLGWQHAHEPSTCPTAVPPEQYRTPTSPLPVVDMHGAVL
jgi:hypothetical protein